MANETDINKLNHQSPKKAKSIMTFIGWILFVIFAFFMISKLMRYSSDRHSSQLQERHEYNKKQALSIVDTYPDLPHLKKMYELLYIDKKITDDELKEFKSLALRSMKEGKP